MDVQVSFQRFKELSYQLDGSGFLDAELC